MTELATDRLVKLSAVVNYDFSMMSKSGEIKAHLDRYGQKVQLHQNTGSATIRTEADPSVAASTLRNPFSLTGAAFLRDKSVIVFNSNLEELPGNVESALANDQVIGVIVGGKKDALLNSSLARTHANVVYVEPRLEQGTRLGISPVFTLIVEMADPQKGGKVFYGYTSIDEAKLAFA